MAEPRLAAPPPAVAPTRRPLPWLGRRYALEVRAGMAWPWQALVMAAAVLAGGAMSAAILVAAGVPAGNLVDEFLVQTFFDAQNARAVLLQAAPLILVGIGASVAFKARFWNLGLEGQMIWGGIGATAVAIGHVGPDAVRLPLMFLAAAACAVAWTAGPVWLKLRLGVNEIISTLMLDYIAGNFLLHLLYGAWKDPKDSFPYSPQFGAAERLPEIAPGIGAGIALALGLAVLAGGLVSVSRAGFYLRFVDANPTMAAAVGVPVKRIVTLAVLVSGGLAGVAGFAVAAGQDGRLTQAFYQGYGFEGVLIAFLARNNPLAASVVAVLFAALLVTGRSLQVFYQIPFSMVQLIQAILVIGVAASDFFIRYRLRRVGG